MRQIRLIADRRDRVALVLHECLVLDAPAIGGPDAVSGNSHQCHRRPPSHNLRYASRVRCGQYSAEARCTAREKPLNHEDTKSTKWKNEKKERFFSSPLRALRVLRGSCSLGTSMNSALALSAVRVRSATDGVSSPAWAMAPGLRKSVRPTRREAVVRVPEDQDIRVGEAACVAPDKLLGEFVPPGLGVVLDEAAPLIP